jgi:hypothetical protein
MSISPHARRDPPPSPSTAIRRRRATAGLLLLLLTGFPALALSPNELAAIRVGGLSILWWYGGVLAPVAAATAVAFLCAPSAGGPPSAPGAPTGRAQDARRPELP